MRHFIDNASLGFYTTKFIMDHFKTTCSMVKECTPGIPVKFIEVHGRKVR
jgi:hypothetical protein